MRSAWIVCNKLAVHAGPILLEDYHLIEKLAQFDRERIPERVVHARGASAKGFFEVRAVACALSSEPQGRVGVQDICQKWLLSWPRPGQNPELKAGV